MCSLEERVGAWWREGFTDEAMARGGNTVEGQHRRCWKMEAGPPHQDEGSND